MHCKPRRLSPFDARSVLLFATLTFGGMAAVQAQGAAASKPPSTFGPSAAARAAPDAARPKSSMEPDAQISAAFAKADTNRDGKMSAHEANALPAMGNQFELLDGDKDGFLSSEEFAKGAQP